jgi:hypothetical protein
MKLILLWQLMYEQPVSLSSTIDGLCICNKPLNSAMKTLPVKISMSSYISVHGPDFDFLFIISRRIKEVRLGDGSVYSEIIIQLLLYNVYCTEMTIQRPVGFPTTIQSIYFRILHKNILQ